MAVVRFPIWERDFPVLRSLEAEPGAHPASYPVVPGVQRPEREAPCIAQIENGGGMPSLPHGVVFN